MTYPVPDAPRNPPESRAEAARDRFDALIARLLPSVLRDAERLYPADAFSQAAWVRFGWTRGGDPINAAIAEAALDVLKPSFSALELDVWSDCIDNGDLTTHTGAIAARRLYREDRRRSTIADTAPEAHAA